MLCSVFQRYNPKANHNSTDELMQSRKVVLSISKIQSKSKSQPVIITGNTTVSCAQYFKDTIQKQITTRYDFYRFACSLCSVFQRYNPKANHNYYIAYAQCSDVVLSISKIQSKSKSQPGIGSGLFLQSCAQYFKDTIQKQITTYSRF